MAPQDTGVDPDISEAPPSGEMMERILESALAALPRGLLASLALGQATRARTSSGGRSGAERKSQQRGRPIGARAGEPRAGQRLHVLETLRAAAPWQRLRGAPAGAGRIQVRK